MLLSDILSMSFTPIFDIGTDNKEIRATVGKWINPREYLGKSV